MKTKNLNTLMDFYYELTRSSILLLETDTTINAIYSCGLSYNRLNEIFEFEEVIDFLNHKSPDILSTNKDSDFFITYKTANHFIYNLIFLNTSKHNSPALIAGPMLAGFPTIEQINVFSKNARLALKERQIILQELYHLPKFSKKKIASTGKLLYVLLNNAVDNLEQIQQILPNCFPYESTKKESFLSESHSFDVGILFDFLMKVEKEFMEENHSKITDTIQDNIHDLDELVHKYDNLYSLKSYCLILCTTSYFHALNSNISFEILFQKLWGFVTRLGPLHTAEEVIQLMNFTLMDFSQTMYMENQIYSPHVNQILKYISLHYAEKITLEHLAEQFHITPVYISHIIKKDTSLTLSDHINLARIKQSKTLLSHTEKSIGEIAFSLGYNYQSHFTKAFKKYTKKTPSEYRAQTYHSL